jgi:hypothetical protein
VGSILTISWDGGASQVKLTGWTGGPIDGIDSLASIMGGDLAIIPGI